MESCLTHKIDTPRDVYITFKRKRKNDFKLLCICKLRNIIVITFEQDSKKMLVIKGQYGSGSGSVVYVLAPVFE